MYQNSQKLNEHTTISVSDLNKLKTVLKEGKIGKVNWCGSAKCWNSLKGLEEGSELFGTDLKKSKGKCIVCSNTSEEIGYVANTY
jgi:hypothetical protein